MPELFDYQRDAIRFINEAARDYRGAALFLDPGLGKTLTVLSWLDQQKPLRTLIVAPPRVARTVWPAEVAKWEFLFSVGMLTGTPLRRLQTLSEDHDVYVTTPDLVPWLSNQSHGGFDVLVVDESTLFKTWTAKRTRDLVKLRKSCSFAIILTGTPASESYMALYPQVFLLDQGESLGTWPQFLNRYCQRGGFKGRQWKFKPHAREPLEKAIRHLVFRVDASKHIDLPAVVENDVFVELPEDAREAYRQARYGAAVAQTTTGVTSFYNTCRHIANGGYYDWDGDGSERRTIHLHTAKVDAAADIVEELNGKPALVFYQFQSDLLRLQKRFPDAGAIFGGQSARESTSALSEWNSGRLRVLLCQNTTVRHGLNMQHGPGRDIVWIGLPDSLDTYLQANARLARHGQSADQIRVHRILARDTIDETIRGWLDERDQWQTALLERLENWRSACSVI